MWLRNWPGMQGSSPLCRSPGCVTFSKSFCRLLLSSPAARHFARSSSLIAGRFGKRFRSSVCALNFAQKPLVPAVAVIRVARFVRKRSVLE